MPDALQNVATIGVQAMPDEDFIGPPWPPPGSWIKLQAEEKARGFSGPELDLPSIAEPVPPMPATMLPEALRGFLEDIAIRQGVPIEFPAIAAIVAAGSLLGRKLTIRPRRLDDWTVTPNLWGALVGSSSTMKTPAIAAGTMPLRRIAAASDEEHYQRRATRNALTDALTAQKTKAVRAAGNSGADEDEAVQRIAAIQSRIDAQKIESARRRYFVNDATVEALIGILAENPDGVLNYRDELSGLLAALDRQGHEQDRPFLLEAWNGGVGGTFEQDRIGRGNVRVAGPCVSILGGIQPARLARYVQGTVHGGAEADGFLARFQLVGWPDDGAIVPGVDRAPDVVSEALAVRAFRALDKAPDGFAAEIEDGALPFLRFAPDAQSLFNAWLKRHHTMLRSKEILSAPAFESHLVKQRKLVPSLALIFHALDVALGTASGTVSAGALALALEWTQFLTAHARKLYAAELREDVTAAHALAARIAVGAVTDGMGVRDIAERDWTGLGNAGAVHAALDVLTACQIARRESVRTGGRPQNIIRLRPVWEATS